MIWDVVLGPTESNVREFVLHFGRKIVIWDVGPESNTSPTESNRVHTSQNFDGKSEKDEVPT